MAVLAAVAGGPRYQFAQLLDFSVLDDGYLRLLASHFARVHRASISASPIVDFLQSRSS